MYRVDYSVLEKLKLIKPFSEEWTQQRSKRIPSSLIRRAVSMNDVFLDYYNTEEYQNQIGNQVEQLVLNSAKSDIERTGMYVNNNTQWISATPDAWHLSFQVPVEIKTSKKSCPIVEIVRKNYHQIQFEMFCTHKKKLLLIYVADKKIQFALVELDQPFVDSCLSRLKETFIVHFFSRKCRYSSYENYLSAIKTIAEIQKLPDLKDYCSPIKKKIILKTLRFDEALPSMDKQEFLALELNLIKIFNEYYTWKPVKFSSEITHIVRKSFT